MIILTNRALTSPLNNDRENRENEDNGVMEEQPYECVCFECQSSRPCELALRIRRPGSEYNYEIDDEETETSRTYYQNI